jgi:acetamidase/formamidase
LIAIEAALMGPFEFHVRSDLHLKSLRAEAPGAWITMRFDEDLDAAAKAALRDMIELIRAAVRHHRAQSPQYLSEPISGGTIDGALACQERQCFVSSGEGVSYPCIFFSRI